MFSGRLLYSLKRISVVFFNLLWCGVECREQVSIEVPVSGFNCLRLGVFHVRRLLLGHNAVGTPFVNAILPQSQNLFACDCGPFTLIKWLRQRIERNAPRFRTSDRYWLRIVLRIAGIFYRCLGEIGFFLILSSFRTLASRVL